MPVLPWRLLNRKPRFRLFDTQFSHTRSSGSSDTRVSPSFFTWERKSLAGKVAFFTDSSLPLSEAGNFQKKVAWLLESPVVYPEASQYALQNIDRFDYILTHQSDLLELDRRILFSPAGGCWIRTKDSQFYPKSKLVSMIYSKKLDFEGHRIRHKVADRFRGQIDLYGSGSEPVKSKLAGLRDYAFAVVIENCRSDFYFTEKLIDALSCGAIPVYWGCPSIGRFFDTEGMISFENPDELDAIISGLSMELYRSKLKAVASNFEKAKKFRLAEDYMWLHYRDSIF